MVKHRGQATAFVKKLRRRIGEEARQPDVDDVAHLLRRRVGDDAVGVTQLARVDVRTNRAQGVEIEHGKAGNKLSAAKPFDNDLDR